MNGLPAQHDEDAATEKPRQETTDAEQAGRILRFPGAQVLDRGKLNDIWESVRPVGELLVPYGSAPTVEVAQVLGASAAPHAAMEHRARLAAAGSDQGDTLEWMRRLSQILYGNQHAFDIMVYLAKWLDDFESSPDVERRLSALRYVSQHCRYLSAPLLQNLAHAARREPDMRLRGEICYALGQYGDPRLRSDLRLFLDDPEPWVRRKAEQALQQLSRLEETKALEGDRAPTRELAEQMTRLTEEFVMLRATIERSQPKAPPARPPLSAEAQDELLRNRGAYEHTQRELSAAYPGQYAVFNNGELLLVDPNELTAARRALSARPGARIYVRQLAHPLPPEGIQDS